MQKVHPDRLPDTDVPWPPTEDDLPSSDGMPMETHRHVLQMTLLMDVLMVLWADRTDVFVGGNMFVYFSPDQLLTQDFRGPDVFVVFGGVEARERKSWIVWQEGGRGPDVVIELLSESTAQRDKTEKKRIYQDRLRVPEYFWYDPFSAELVGFALLDGEYQPITPDAAGRLPCGPLDLTLRRWNGTYGGVEATWLRWATADGSLLPTAAELAAEQERRAEDEQRRADEERQRADRAEQRIAELEARLARIEAQLGGSPDEAG
ncbi:MAG: Uma2 family endonuclease [Dehalococcoidia bacterium]